MNLVSTSLLNISSNVVLNEGHTTNVSPTYLLVQELLTLIPYDQEFIICIYRERGDQEFIISLYIMNS